MGEKVRFWAGIGDLECGGREWRGGVRGEKNVLDNVPDWQFRQDSGVL